MTPKILIATKVAKNPEKPMLKLSPSFKSRAEAWLYRYIACCISVYSKRRLTIS